MRAEGQPRLRLTGLDELRPQDGDHRAVVGAEPRARTPEGDAVLGAPLSQQRPEPRVGRDPAAEEQGGDPVTQRATAVFSPEKEKSKRCFTRS